jgi:hypothetical protein
MPPSVEEEDTCTPKKADEYARHVKEAAALIQTGTHFTSFYWYTRANTDAGGASAYPDWARSTGTALQHWGQSGEWTYSRGPPYVKKLTMFKGAGVDQVGVGTLWRRVLGLNTAAGRSCDLRSCDHAMTGNSYINTFDGRLFSLLLS